MTSSCPRARRVLPALGALLLLAACRDASGPNAAGSAITYVRYVSGPDPTPATFVVASPDGSQTYASYPVAFTPSEAELSPDHTRLLLAHQADSSLWVQTLSDGSAREIVGPHVADAPDWSPDGRHVLYRNASAGSAAWVVDPDGANAHALATDSAAYKPQRDLEWSPDAGHIAFDSDYGGMSRLYVMNADGSGARVVPVAFQGGPGYAYDPAWSPDGQRLAFGMTTDSTPAIFTVALDGSGLRRLTSGGVGQQQPAWSPDGSRIAFVSQSSVGAYQHLFVVTVATGALTQLRGSTTEGERTPHWIRWP